MIRIILSVLTVHLCLAGPVGWAEEPEARPDTEPPALAAEPPVPSAELVPSSAEERPEMPSVPETSPAEAPTPPDESGQFPVEEKSEKPPGPETPSADPPVPAAQPTPPPLEDKGEEEKAAERALQQPEEQRKPAVAEEEIEPAAISRKRGQLSVNLSLSYSHNSSNQLFINGFTVLPILVVGQVTVERIRRDSFSTSLSLRYGITDALNVQLRLPYSFSLVQTSQATGTVQPGQISPNEGSSSRRGGLGDVNLGFTYPLFSGTLTWPRLVGGLSFKLRTGRDIFEIQDPALDPPTGTGFNSISASLSMIKIADPAVLSGSVSYGYAIPRKDVLLRSADPPILLDFSPGDNVGLSGGLSFALNSKLTLSFRYNQAITFPTRINGRKTANSLSNVISLGFGGTWRINEKRSISLSIGWGLTLDAPDATVTVRIPYKF